MSFLHDTDSNNLPRDSRVGQVSKYLDELRSNFRTYYIFERELDIDECMVEYFGRYGTFLTVCQQKWNLHDLSTNYGVPVCHFGIFLTSTSVKVALIANIANFFVGASIALDVIDGCTSG